MTQGSVDPVVVEYLVRILRDQGNAEPAGSFPRDGARVNQPGLYAWWVEDAGRAVLSSRLEVDLPPLIYAGLAGATRWPSGKASPATLLSRVQRLHLRGNIRGSTLRLALAAILAEPLGLTITGPNRLNAESEQRLSRWMTDHLAIIAEPYPDRDTLGVMEEAILSALDPPLNLRGMASSAVRVRVAQYRQRLAHPA